jgi:replicative DNA helicase
MLNPVPSSPGSSLPIRTPPHNFDAEQALLGAILINNRAVERVSEFLKPGHFAEPLHGRIYGACLALSEHNQVANPVTLKTYLAGDPDLARLGGDGYLARLAGAAVTIINAEDYGRLIYDLHLRRELIALGEDVVNDAFVSNPENSAPQQIEEAERRLFELAKEGESEGGFRPFSESMKLAITQAEAAHKREGKLSGVTTGLRDLNRMLGGLHPSDLVILAGRPSMGKTALATKMAVSAARAFREEVSETGQKKVVDGAMVAFFSLEMSAEQIANRVLAERAEIPSDKIRKGQLSRDGTEFDRLVMASQELNKLPLYIDDTPALSVSAVRTRARRLQRQHGLGLIVVDYLQMLTQSFGKRAENRVQEVSDITRQLKALAKELKVPVLALSQLSRAVESRDDKRPQLADLRESGSIEQDADMVMFVYREEYYLSRGEPAQGTTEHEEWKAKVDAVYNKAEVIVAKQRHGPVGTVAVFFDGRFTRFGDLDEQHGDPPFGT